jgi:uncharacterized protein
MDETFSHFSINGKSPLIQMLISLLTILVAGMFIFNVLLLAGTIIFGENFWNLLGGNLADLIKKDSEFLRYMLISQDIAFFIVPAIIILNLLKPPQQKNITDIKIPRLNEIFLVILLAFCIFPITSFTGQLNSGMHLPDWFSGLEKWIIEKEDNANHLIGTLLDSDSFGIMLINVLVIAVVPAIGEELIFRGVIQKIFCRLFKSGHVAVWVTAFIFSALHLQFFGFIPRLILGLVFGYLFLLSGTLWLPIIVHFVNNAVPVAGAYIEGWTTFNESAGTPLSKQILMLPVPILISFLIMFYFWKKSKRDAEISKEKYCLPDN